MTQPPAIMFDRVVYGIGDLRAEFSFQRHPGSVTAILGPSGAGKSTLLNLAAGFLVPDSGVICMDGRSINGLPPSGRGVSIVFQDNNLFAHLDIRTNIGLGLDPALRLDQPAWSTVDKALERVGLAGFGRRMPGTLSGGERQRVALARAFARRRPLLLLDEPFDGLGPGLAADMLGLMLEIRAEVGATVLMVTHDPDEARAAADQILFIAKGRIAADAPSDGFFERRDLPELDAYLGSTGET
ncbi:ATP-binding cassette domain-containing protein [Hoeflea sp. YIM 152468]|uniref:thiamine ABC transporter ATP-binding protein n=1 Tax=Hoeflea sp. YIM 152468 TaxID=3031759 RepID=UPI0023D9A7FA|nr:ATP-binding cassette domain-containing protein [Hoeflea sp. YIM 152468]MDF1608117.1 ATP-binding cassette domain-containing protein [Hoeflea sp. YIM 152468]